MNINSLSEEQLAGQRLMVGFNGTKLNDELQFLIQELGVGGIILFSRNLETPDQIEALCESAQGFADKCGQPALLISIDQEGGKVARLKEPFTQFPGNPAMTDEADAVRFAEITASELSGVGVNMDMAPVLDVIPEKGNSVMATRAFGDDPGWVSRLGTEVIRHLQQNNIMAVAKHFPGIGRTTLDSHDDLPTVAVDLNTLNQTDLVPFKAAVEQNVAGMMVSHIMYDQIDDQWPASLSSRVVNDLLRKTMGYGGVVITDDLDMGAIQNHYDIHTIMKQILNAEIDTALICHSLNQMETAFRLSLDFLKRSPENMQSGVRSVERILGLKKKYLGI